MAGGNWLSVAGVGGTWLRSLLKSNPAVCLGLGGLGAAGREAPLHPALPDDIPDPDAEAAGREVPLLPAPEIDGDPGFGIGKNRRRVVVEVAPGVVARAGGTGGGALAGKGAGGGALADNGGNSSSVK